MAQGKNKKAAFLQQSQDIVKRTQALFKERQRSSTVVFYKASRVEHVKPMFELVWMSFLVTFSGPMQDSEVRPTWLARSRPRRAAPPPPSLARACDAYWFSRSCLVGCSATGTGPGHFDVVPRRVPVLVPDQQHVLLGAAEERWVADVVLGRS